MANNGKFLNLEAGKYKLDTAIATTTGVADAAKIIRTDSTGRLDTSLLPIGVGPDVKLAPASEALGAGKYVNFWLDSGVVKVRLADSSNARDAQGFVKDAVANAAQATVFFEGPNTGLSGLTLGQRYYLGTGGTPTDVPATTGIHQYLGVAVDANTLNTDIDDIVVL